MTSTINDYTISNELIYVINYILYIFLLKSFPRSVMIDKKDQLIVSCALIRR